MKKITGISVILLTCYVDLNITLEIVVFGKVTYLRVCEKKNMYMSI